jgi:hypothetical protein
VESRIAAPVKPQTTMNKVGMTAMVLLAITVAACTSSQAVPPTTQNGISPISHPATTTTAIPPVTKLVRLPNTVGTMDTVATRVLSREGLAIRLRVGDVPSTSGGVVVGQVPARGRVPLGTMVVLTVSVARSASKPPGVPPGFLPEWVSAISTRQWWVLGNSCSVGLVCTNSSVVIETKNAGKTFVDLNVRGLAASRIAFIDSLHGFAYGSPQGILYATDDGGVSWTEINLPGPVTSLAIGKHYVFAVVKGSCPSGTLLCLSSRLYRAPRDTETWAPVASGVAGGSNSVATYGDSVIFNRDEQTGPAADYVFVSRNGGTTFARYPGPGLYCEFSFGGATTIYAYCRSGMFYFLSRLANGRQSFLAPGDLNGLNGCPVGIVAGVSPSVVVGTCGGEGQNEPVLRSDDGGASSQTVLASNGHQEWQLVGSGPGRVIFAASRSHLWWSRDGGATWWPVL